MKLVFASNSPRRKELLSKFDIDIKFNSHSFDESSIKKNINPYNYCQLIAEGKSSSLVDKYPNTPIISADTIVVSSDNKIFEKPKKNQEAFDMLSTLSGNTHKVLTGVNILYLAGDMNFTFVEEDICNLTNLVWSSEFINYSYSYIYNNQFCPPYPECIENYVGEQDTTNCD